MYGYMFWNNVACLYIISLIILIIKQNTINQDLQKLILLQIETIIWNEKNISYIVYYTK